MSNYGKRDAGFTLIELLIVVAIISVLAAIAVPNFLLAQKRAYQARCSANLRTIAVALQSYKVDHNKYPLADGIAGEEESMGETSIGMGPAANGSWDAVPRVLVRLNYLNSAEHLFCPSYYRQFRSNQDKLQRFRYAYNNSAADTGGASGGSHHMDKDSTDVWFCRCQWVPREYSFTPADKEMAYPHGENTPMENTLFSNARVELRDGKSDFKTIHRIP